MNIACRLWVLAAMVLPASGWACRCAERSLPEYFSDADVVVMGRLVRSSESRDQRILTFELIADPHKGAPNAAREDQLSVSTAISTATCGVQPDIDAIYIVFGHYGGEAGKGTLHVDSCSGTRIHLSRQLTEPNGFVDVPARFVASQLNGLAGMAVLRDVSGSAPDAGDPENDRLVGLLDLEPLAHGGWLDIFSAPDKTSRRIGRISDYSDVESLEYAYEQPGAVVFARLPGWFRVRLAKGQFGWLQAGESGTFFSYANLPVRRLSYIKPSWSGFLWPGPGAGLPIRNPRAGKMAPDELPINVIESAIIGDMPWFRIGIYDGEICAGPEPATSFSGWVPGYGTKGEPNLWFYSRGC